MRFTRQFLVYIAVGVVSALVDIGTMYLLILQGINNLVSATLGFSLGLLLNFFLHTWITFGMKYSHVALFRYLVVVFINYLLTLMCVSIFQFCFEMPILGKLFSLPLVALNGFWLIKHWVHR